MTAIGGSIESITLNGREFSVTADSDSSRKLGGFENEVQPNGNGTARIIKTRVPMGIDGLTVQVDDSRGDHEFLQGLSDSNDFFAVAITYASGVTYQGRAMITAELSAASQNATASVSLMGPGALVQQ